MNRCFVLGLFAVFAIVFIASCEGASTATGMLVVTAHGGVEAREGIPASRTQDGYAIHYRHVVLELEDLRLEARDGDSAAISVTPVVVELVPTPTEAFRVHGIPPRRWDAVRFSSRPVPEDARVADGVDPDIVTRMREEGWSLYLEGTLVGRAPPDGAEGEIPFAFGMPVAIDYLDCASGDGTLGIVIPAERRGGSGGHVAPHAHVVRFFRGRRGASGGGVRCGLGRRRSSRASRLGNPALVSDARSSWLFARR